MSKKATGVLVAAASVCAVGTLLVGDLSAFLILAIAVVFVLGVFVAPLAAFVYVIAKGWSDTRPPRQ